MSKVLRISLAAILAGAIGVPAGIPAPISREVLPMTPAPARLPVEGEFPSLGGATAWLNSPPLTPESLRGKVVLARGAGRRSERSRNPRSPPTGRPGIRGRPDSHRGRVQRQHRDPHLPFAHRQDDRRLRMISQLACSTLALER